jgi:hypothetical protein
MVRARAAGAHQYIGAAVHQQSHGPDVRPAALAEAHLSRPARTPLKVTRGSAG